MDKKYNGNSGQVTYITPQILDRNPGAAVYYIGNLILHA